MTKSDQYIAIIGLGVSGLACARFLYLRGLSFVMLDTRENPPEVANFLRLYPNVPLILGRLDEAILAAAQQIIVSPGISIATPVIARQKASGIPVIGDIELFAQAVTAPVIAITGTNAKSTVTTLVGAMLRAAKYQVAVGGNLGTPALQLLLDQPAADVFVLELSSFQLETTYSLRPRVASVLNISPDHMDRYADFAGYQQAKLRIYHQCAAAVCNREDPLTYYHGPAPCIYFTTQVPQADEFGLHKQATGQWLAYGQDLILSTTAIPAVGKHYYANALAALAIGHSFGIDQAAMKQVLTEFHGLPHRCQLVRKRGGVFWYNDSKGTNVGATLAAICGLGAEIRGKLVMIMGGVGKNADFSPLTTPLAQYARHVILLGQAAVELSVVIPPAVGYDIVDDMQAAVFQAGQRAEVGDCILLSPACASFDMFKNFEERGQVFMNYVLQLPQIHLTGEANII